MYDPWAHDARPTWSDPLRIHALSDPHLSYGTPAKAMDRFGPQWVRHGEKIAQAWSEVVSEDDLVLVPGDISWAMKLEAAQPDLDFLRALPGTKVLMRGNHDYWWSSAGKVRRALGEGFLVVQGDALHHRGVLLAGSRMWDVPGLSFSDVIDWSEDADDTLRSGPDPEQAEKNARIFDRELAAMDRALLQLETLRRQHPRALRVVLTHYPPCGPRLEASCLTERFEDHGVEHVVFGHLHSVRRDCGPLFGEREGVRYHLASCDWLDFRPLLVAEVDAAPAEGDDGTPSVSS